MTDTESLTGKTLGKYEIKEKIGQGGMAQVFKAYQPALNRFVAIKVLAPTLAHDSDFTQRFQREAHAVARLNHPNILPVYDFGLQESYNYIVMRYVANSVTLGTLMRQGLSTDLLINYIVQVADALNFAHDQGIIHRDIKPGNILIDDKWALVSDFGLVKDRAVTSEITTTGIGMGTPAYMSPEQAKGLKVDHRTDIYALGIILHKVLTGTIPHDASPPLAIMLKRTTEPVPPLRQINPNISKSLELVTMRALEHEPDRRYSSATGFAKALLQAQSDPNYQDEETLPDPTDSEATVLSSTAAGSASTLANQTTLSGSPPATKGKPKTGLLIGGGIVIVVMIGLLLWSSMLGRDDKGTIQSALGANTSGEAEIATVTNTETEIPTHTPLPPTEPPTPLPLGTPQAIAKTDIEIWSGPGEAYELLGYLPAGAIAEISSRDQSSEWWQIKTGLSSKGTGWVSANSEFTDAVDTHNVPIALTPPTPTVPATPTPTDIPTFEPAATETAAPTETATVTPQSPTTVVTASLTPLPTPTLPTGEIILLKPASTENPTFGLTEFEWQWNGPLPENQGFEVRVWRTGEPPAGVHNAVLDNKNDAIQAIDHNSYRLTVDIADTPGVRRRRGEYNWTVALVQIEPEYKDLGLQASAGQLRFEPGGSGASSSGGGGEGGGGGLVGGN